MDQLAQYNDRLTPRRMSALYGWNATVALFQVATAAALFAPIYLPTAVGWPLFASGIAAEFLLLIVALIVGSPPWLREIRVTRQALKKRREHRRQGRA